MDPQGQLGKVLGLEVRSPRRSSIELLVNSVLGEASASVAAEPEPRAELPVVTTRIPNLDVIVANKALALFPTWTGGVQSDTTQRLRRALEESPAIAAYDFVLIDAPPSFGPLTLNILCACHELVIPVPLTYLALDGCAELMRTMSMVRRRYQNPKLRISMVIPTFYRRTRLANEILERLKTRFPKEIAHTVVGYHVKIDEAQSRGLSIFEYAPRARGAEAMAALAEELETRGAPAAWGEESAIDAAPTPHGEPAEPRTDSDSNSKSDPGVELETHETNAFGARKPAPREGVDRHE